MFFRNTCVCPRNARTEIYAGRVACCPLVSHVEYAPRALLRLGKDGTDGRTDVRTPDRYITLTARRGQGSNCCMLGLILIRYLYVHLTWL